jgi:hypothetical protein
MADLHKLTVQEAMNASGPGGVWTVNSVSTTGSNASTGNTVHVDVSGAGQLGLYSSGEIYFSFSAKFQDITTANDLKLPAEALTFITIPRGLGATIYFNHLSTSTTAHTVRIVEV